jgi:hypothetical protein
MRTHENKADDSQPKIRSPQIRLNQFSETTIPEIRLRGNWLKELGFLPNQRVNITTMNKMLIVRLDE